MADFDSSAAVFKGGAEQLLKIITVGETLPEMWTDRDRSVILQHQLSAPLCFDSKTHDAAAQSQGEKALKEATTLGLKSFRDLFQHPQPPLPLLRLAKDFFKEKAG